jgi:hypothetical protein
MGWNGSQGRQWKMGEKVVDVGHIEVYGFYSLHLLANRVCNGRKTMWIF